MPDRSAAVSSSPPASTPPTDVTASIPAPPGPPAPRPSHDDDLDDLNLNVRKNAQADSLALTAMILGITSLTMATAGVCICGVIGGLLALVTGGLAIYFGLQAKTVPGSESYAKTGIMCGSIGVGVAIIAIIGVIVFLLFLAAQGGF